MTGFADFQGRLVSRVSCSTAGMVAYRSNPAEHLLWAFNARYRLRSWPTPCCCLSRYPVLCGTFRRAAQLGLSHRCRRHRCARRLASPRHRPAGGARRQHHRRLLNISFGNTAELILALFVLSRAHTRIVQAQIIGTTRPNGVLPERWPVGSRPGAAACRTTPLRRFRPFA